MKKKLTVKKPEELVPQAVEEREQALSKIQTGDPGVFQLGFQRGETSLIFPIPIPQLTGIAKKLGLKNRTVFNINGIKILIDVP